MADDKRSVITILEDDTTKEGVKLPARATGDASGGNHLPAIHSVDSGGLYVLDQKRVEGEAAAAVSSSPVLGGQDSAGNLQFTPLRADAEAAAGVIGPAPLIAVSSSGVHRRLQVRDEGQSATGVDSAVGLVAKDESNNLQFLPISGGKLLVTGEAPGTERRAHGALAASALDTVTTIAEVSITASKVVDQIQCRGSCNFPAMWELVQVNDVTITVLDSFLTGPGQFTVPMKYDHMKFTAGATGAQNLRLRGTQLTGVLSFLRGYVECLELA